MQADRRAEPILRELSSLAGSSWRRDGTSLLAPEWIAAGGGAVPGDADGEVLRETPGKRTRRLKLRGGLDCIVKQHRRAAARGPASPPPAIAGPLEALRALELARAGLRVPRPLAAGCEAGGSWVVLERVPHARSLEDELERDPARVRARLPEIGRLLAALHRAGFHHRDFYLCHLLVDERSSALVLIDLERVGELGVRARRWRVKDAAQLAFSLQPLLPRRAQLAFLAHYARAAGHSRDATRRFASAALRVAARIARHAPRHGAPPLGLAPR